MKATRKLLWPASLCLFSVLCAVACAGGPPPQGEPSVAVRVLNRSEIKSRWGAISSANPFLEPRGLIKGQPDEFIVIEVDFFLPARSSLSFDASAEGADGQTVAWMKDAAAFFDYWSVWDTMGDSSKRAATIQSDYLRGKAFAYPSGNHRYFLVLVGKNPLPRPATIRVAAQMENLGRSWELPLPEHGR